MTDKEKQIEEMAKEIFNTCAWRFGKPEDYKEIFNDIAEDLSKLNYRKIPEDSVLLLRGEYEELKQCKKDKELAYFGWEDALNSLKGLNADLKQISKKTIEKIVYLLADYKEYDYESYSYKDWCVPHTIIKHIAQSVGIDIRTLNDKPTKKPLKFNGVEIKIVKE